MQNHTQKKPSKPHPDFPLFPHASGRWAKKVRGKLCYFGPWADPDAALKRWLDEKDDLLAGRKPRAKLPQGLTIRDLCNRFYAAKLSARDSGELRPRTCADYRLTCDRIVTAWASGNNHHRLVEDLQPEDFAAYRAQIAKSWGPVSVGNEVQRVRTVLKYAYDESLIDRPVRFGASFKKPSRKTLRTERAKRERRFLDRDEINALLTKAGIQLKAMIYLAVNCGMGNTDLAELNWRHIDLDAGILDYPRPKTGVERRATLWPQTVKALKAVKEFALSPVLGGPRKGLPHYQPSNPDNADAVFLTHDQQRFVRHNGEYIRDCLSEAFAKILKKTTVKDEKGKETPIKREGVNFYALRHTFETIAGETRDQAAVDRIMGHADASMSAVYREWLRDERENERLRRVTDHVRGWLIE